MERRRESLGDSRQCLLFWGMISLTISSILPGLRPKPCQLNKPCEQASALDLWVLYISLFLTSLGSGGLRPCVVAFGADQLNLVKSTGRASRSSIFFNWYYIIMGLATLMALTVAVYIQDNVGWGWGLGLPTIAMAISVVVFVFGYPLYKTMKPGGSPLTRLAQVVVAAFKKRNSVRPADPGLLYENGELDAAISTTGKIIHTNQLRFFDRAAIKQEGDELESGHPNLWKISTVHRVEELKSVIRLMPIWAVGIMVVAANSHQNSFSIQQARTMNRHLSHSFQIPPATMSIFAVLPMLLALVAYNRLFVPITSRFTGNPSGISYLQRIGIGLTINILATIAAALVEVKRKSVAADHGLLDKPQAIIPISVFWLVPQYSIHGLGEAFVAVGHMEFLYDQSPESMRSIAAALSWLAIAAGSYLSTFIVSLVHKYSGEERNWVPDTNLNRGRLECYYWLVSGLQVLNIVYYIVCARFYTYKTLEVKGPADPPKENDIDGDGHVELTSKDKVDVGGEGHVESV
ncbi:protein NRT1/ PTR FAMILY 3.1-like isoform X2 [Tasmannia lanceolata]|uniref:protein NRT1/ PTR FAMILY 3.1-like isoform X2 n=1 Tax=Tasmannia lanceolata TaxID=3420 RepID=UPI0040627E01